MPQARVNQHIAHSVFDVFYRSQYFVRELTHLYINDYIEHFHLRVTSKGVHDIFDKVSSPVHEVAVAVSRLLYEKIHEFNGV